MSGPTRYSSGSSYSYGGFDRSFDTGLSAGERIGALPPRRSRALRRIAFVLLLAGAGGWAYLGDTSFLTQWLVQSLPPEIAALLPGGDHKPAQLADAAAPAIPPSEPTAMAEPVKVRAVEAPPQSFAAPSASETAAPTVVVSAPVAATETETAAAPEREAKAEDEAPPERLPPPVVDLSDPYQRKATAVGLHPELSRALLEKLSAADYRNAGIAIKTALAETPDSEVFVWPRERKPGVALFQVKFVPGAPADCRRYVVAISKDGWVTTALPMERCGLKPVVRAAARVSPAPEKGYSSAP
jgi:hypothetical protein